MAVRIRLRREGARNAPYYRVVVADKQSPRDGRFIEILGSYHPTRKENNFSVNMERVRYWMQKGAQPSETVRSFLKRAEKEQQTAPSA